MMGFSTPLQQSTGVFVCVGEGGTEGVRVGWEIVLRVELRLRLGDFQNE